MPKFNFGIQSTASIICFFFQVIPPAGAAQETALDLRFAPASFK